MEFFTTSAGITVHVWDTRDEKSPEDAPVIVLLHGYMETMYIFNELIADLKHKFRIITMDLPGHGLTDRAPVGENGESVNSVEFDVPVICGVLDKCGVEKAAVAGHSMGGYIALECLKDAPERFTKAVLLNAHPYPDAPGSELNREREINIIRSGKLDILAEASIPKMYFEENLRLCDEKIRETVELCETHDPEGIIASIRGIQARPDLQCVLASLPRPILLIYGDHDAFLPLETVEKMKVQFSGVQYCPVASCGHNSFIEKKEAVVCAMEAFLQDITKENC